MSGPQTWLDHDRQRQALKNERAEREDTLIVVSAFVLVALAIGGLLYAYSGPHAGVQTASNLPPIVQDGADSR